MGSPIAELQKSLGIEDIKLEFDINDLAFDCNKPLSFENKPLSFVSEEDMSKMPTMEEFEKEFEKPKEPEEPEGTREILEYLDSIIARKFHKDLTSYCVTLRKEVREGSVYGKVLNKRLHKIENCLKELGVL